MEIKKYKAQVNHLLFFPAIIALWGLYYFLYGERLPANDGLGWDGLKYASFTRDLLSSNQLDSYYCMRIIPSFILHFILELFHIPFSNANIINAFELLNIFCLVTGAYFLKKIFLHLNISLKNQILGFVLLFLNFACGKFIYYYPVLTDASGFLLGIMILYFYFTEHLLNLILITIVAAFTWPPVFFQGLIFLVFPLFHNTFQYTDKKNAQVLSGLSVLFFFILILIFILIKNENTGMVYTIKIDKILLPVSILFLLFFAYHFPKSILNKNFESVNFIRQNLKIKNLLIIAGIVFFFKYVKQLFIVSQSDALSLEFFLKTPVLFGSAEPLIYLVSHTTFYGIVFVLILFLWNEISIKISEFGLGLTLAFLLNLYLVNFTIESRSLINFFPLLVILVILVLEKYNIKKEVYFIFLFLNLFISKIWLSIGYDLNVGADDKGFIAFPNQKLFMNIGPWMSQEMWRIQAIILVLTFFLILLLKRLSFIERKMPN